MVIRLVKLLLSLTKLLMSLYKLRFIFVAFLVLSGCSFQPLYGISGDKDIYQQIGQIKIISPPDRAGQILHNLLLDRINPYGRPRTPKYRLTLDISAFKEELGIKFTEEATRAKLKLQASYELTYLTTGEVLAKGYVRSSNSYNITDSELVRVASEKDAMLRASREVSDEIKVRLGLFFKNWSK